MPKHEHEPMTDDIVNALCDGTIEHMAVVVEMAKDLRESRRLLRALCNETRGTISLKRDGLIKIVGVTNVRVLERKMFEASDYLAACEGKGEEG